MKDKIKIEGKLHYELRDKNNNLKDKNTIKNTVTDFMDAHIADQLSDQGQSQIGWIALGTSTGQGAGDTDLAIYSVDTFLALSGTTSLGVQGTGANDNDVIYYGYWGAGVGTATITEAGVFQASGTSRSTMCLYNDSLNVAKGASDTLKVTWTLTVG